MRADDLVDQAGKGFADFGSGDRHRNHNPGGVFLPESQHRGIHACAGRQPIVYQDYGFSFDLGVRPVVAIGLFAAFKLSLFPAGCLFDSFGGDPQAADHLGVQDPHPAGGDGSHGQLFLARDAQLSHQEDVQRSIDRPGDLVGNGHAASRQGQHQGIIAVGILLQEGCQRLACILPVFEYGSFTAHDPSGSLLVRVGWSGEWARSQKTGRVLSPKWPVVWSCRLHMLQKLSKLCSV